MSRLRTRLSHGGIEGVLTAIERGGAADLGRILIGIDRDTAGDFRADVEQALACASEDSSVAKAISAYLVL